ncbi:UDP-N-acetylmuramoyl-L-alanine--D-glutamate ligase [Pseudomonas sp. F1_0610]|uniref:UDP-N-acetylmuramoyl-L-alanine--D-glutamate ligase n=1 Tax=Pseudomonas sp. F1_0610 TaxID=3114284 RepID=UPI0039C2F235
MQESGLLHIVVGLGKSGMSVVRFLARQGIAFAVADTRSNPPELATLERDYPQVEVRCGELDADWLACAQVLYVSPGLCIKTPAIAYAAAKGVQISGDIDLLARHAKAPIVAITGSNAKSTVTTLVGEMAAAAGKKVAVGGNLGTPALDLLADDVALYVLELSSFQLETTTHLNALVATCLNISEDHMDRYDGQLSLYIQAKQRIFQGANTAVVNLDDMQAYAPTQPIKHLLTFGTQAPADNSFGLAKDAQGALHLAFGQRLLMPVSALKIKGLHNYSNALAALALGRAAGLPMTPMLQALSDFKGLDHRCQWVAEKQGVTYINDSKATNVGAALAAIEGLGADCAGKLILIAGGDGKGADFTELAQPIKTYCRAVVFLGRDAQQIAAVLDDSVEQIWALNMQQAVTACAETAQVGDIVLLSPACSSLDMFKRFEQRGEFFVQAVEGLAL